MLNHLLLFSDCFDDIVTGFTVKYNSSSVIIYAENIEKTYVLSNISP